jgi:hypothetical protein
LHELQGLVDEMEAVKATVTATRANVEQAYDALTVLIAMTTVFTLMFFILAGFGTLYSSRRLMNGSLILLPASMVLLWSTGAVLYGLVLNSADVCDALRLFLKQSMTAQKDSQIRRDLFPCPSEIVAENIMQGSIQAQLNMTLTINELIQGL